MAGSPFSPFSSSHPQPRIPAFATQSSYSAGKPLVYSIWLILLVPPMTAPEYASTVRVPLTPVLAYELLLGHHRAPDRARSIGRKV